MKLIRSLVFPWLVFFVAAVSCYILISTRYLHMQVFLEKHGNEGLILGAICCLLLNIHSMSQVGIWMTESLPESLRYTSIRWLIRAVKAAVVIGAGLLIAKLPWMPLVWQGMILPAIITVGLFVIVWNLLGPILKWSSQLTLSRTLGVLLSIPVLAAIPLTAFVVGKMFVSAYRTSQADIHPAPMVQVKPPEVVQLKGLLLSVAGNEMRMFGEWPKGSGQNKAVNIKLNSLPPSTVMALPKTPSKKELTVIVKPELVVEAPTQSEPNHLDTKDIHARLHSPQTETRASTLREIYEFSDSCSEYSKDIHNALDPHAPKAVAYWATQALKCSDVKAVVAMPKLVQLMYEHPDAEVRGAAIRAMKKYGDENIKRVTYLLIKRVSAQEPPEVVTAAAALMAGLADDSTRVATNRLKGLLDVTRLSAASAQSLIQDFKRDDLVTEFVEANLVAPDAEARGRAVGMICALPKSKREFAEDHVSEVLASISSVTPDDPGVKALHCLGKVGVSAVSAELSKPQKLKRPMAARLLAQMNVKEGAEAIRVSAQCSADVDEEVRKWCSQTLGQLGAPALPDILKLLNSTSQSLKESGRNALGFFADENAKVALKKVLEDNSGWMANNKKLQIAKAVGTALARIEGEQNSGPAQAAVRKF